MQIFSNPEPQSCAMDTDSWPALGKMIPPPDMSPEEVKEVRAYFRQARREAYELLGVPPPPRKRGPQGRLPLAPPPRRRQKGTCKGCGGEMNGYTEGCVNCVARHSMRRGLARKRAAAATAQ